jgi:hypothetical protein
MNRQDAKCAKFWKGGGGDGKQASRRYGKPTGAMASGAGEMASAQATMGTLLTGVIRLVQRLKPGSRKASTASIAFASTT